jgi:hypothetical protein
MPPDPPQKNHEAEQNAGADPFEEDICHFYSGSARAGIEEGSTAQPCNKIPNQE